MVHLYTINWQDTVSFIYQYIYLYYQLASSILFLCGLLKSSIGNVNCEKTKLRVSPHSDAEKTLF